MKRFVLALVVLTLGASSSQAFIFKRIHDRRHPHASAYSRSVVVTRSAAPAAPTAPVIVVAQPCPGGCKLPQPPAADHHKKK